MERTRTAGGTSTEPVLRTVGLEEHLWTADLRDTLLAQAPDDRDESVTLFNRGPVADRLVGPVDARLEAMAEAGVDMQVLSITAPGTQGLPAQEAVRLARQANDHMATIVTGHPDRFAAFATLPTPDPHAAARELERAVRELGFVGALVFPRTHGRYLDHDSLRPVLETAADLGVPLSLHPQIAPHAVRQTCYSGFSREVEVGLATSAWGWHADVGLCALRLVLAGTFDRHPHLQLILGHWGEMLVTYLDRVTQLSRVTDLERPIASYVADNMHLTSSGIESYRLLSSCLNTVGADRIMFSTDYPFQYSPGGGARAFLEGAPISSTDKVKIGSGNAVKLLGLREPTPFR